LVKMNLQYAFSGKEIREEVYASFKRLVKDAKAEDLTIVELKNLESTLKTEILYLRRNLGFKDNLTDGKIWNDNNMLGEICYIKKEVAPSGKEKAYIYDKVSGVCFKAQRTKIGANVVHSLTYAQMILDGIEPKGLRTVEFDSKAKVASDEETYFYEPDLNNFSYSTQIVYYSSDFKKQHLISIKEYIDLNRPRTLTVGGEVYTFANYTSEGTQVWANIKTTANGIVAYWVWIPRFAYKLDRENNKSDIVFIDLTDNPLSGGTLNKEEYTVHEAFKQGDGLKGIWFAKYPPSVEKTLPIDKTEPEVPDLTNFNTENLKIVYYTADGKSSIEKDYNNEDFQNLFEQGKPPQTIQEGETTYYWYNYSNKVWANIKTTGEGINSYWVWIPRFAYMLDNGTASVILVDEDNKPLDTEKYGDTLPEEYTIHEAFNQETEEDKEPLKGLWFAKYPPSQQIIEVSEEQGGEV